MKDLFKFQNTREKSTPDDVKKNYLCILIITYLEKIIESFYSQHLNKVPKKESCICKINKTQLTKGIFDVILMEIFNETLTRYKLLNFCKSYIQIVTNKTKRSFPRISKTPHTKWYVKGYSIFTSYHKILLATKNNDIESLNKNLKTLAKKFTVISEG